MVTKKPWKMCEIGALVWYGPVLSAESKRFSNRCDSSVHLTVTNVIVLSAVNNSRIDGMMISPSNDSSVQNPLFRSKKLQSTEHLKRAILVELPEVHLDSSIQK